MRSVVQGLLLLVLLASAVLGLYLMIAGLGAAARPPGQPTTPAPAAAPAPEATPPAPAEAPPAPRAPPEPVQAGRGLEPPVKLSGDPPTYTEVARRARIQGVVVVRVVVRADGTVGDVEVLKGLPMGLDRQAVEAVGTWRFAPATRNGEPIAVWTTLTVDFRL